MSDNNTPVMVWFGEMEMGWFSIGHGFSAKMCIINVIHEKRHMLEANIEAYIDANNHTGDYVIPENFNGDIVYSRHYLKGH
jgi:hypothetical protein